MAGLALALGLAACSSPEPVPLPVADSPVPRPSTSSPPTVPPAPADTPGATHGSWGDVTVTHDAHHTTVTSGTLALDLPGVWVDRVAPDISALPGALAFASQANESSGVVTGLLCFNAEGDPDAWAEATAGAWEADGREVTRVPQRMTNGRVTPAVRTSADGRTVESRYFSSAGRACFLQINAPTRPGVVTDLDLLGSGLVWST